MYVFDDSLCTPGRDGDERGSVSGCLVDNILIIGNTIFVVN